MSILHHTPRAELGTKYTHYGWLFGLVPVYVGKADSAAPDITARNWVPEWWFDLCEQLFALFCVTAQTINPLFEPEFPLLITGPIKPKGGGS